MTRLDLQPGDLHADPPATAPVPRDLWAEVLAADPYALPSQSPRWIDCVCADGRYVDASRLYRTSEGQRAVLPLVQRGRRLRGTSAWHSMPAAWGFGGLVSEGPVTPGMVSSVIADLAGQRALRIHIRPNPLHAQAWALGTARCPGVTVIPARAHVLDLSGGFETVWEKRFRSSTRTRVRRAESVGVEVETDTSGRLVPTFYDLLRISTERWARHQHEPSVLAHRRRERRDPVEKFERIAERMGEACRISVAWYQGRPAAAILVLRGRNAHYTRGAMDEAFAGPIQATRLLHKVAIEDACRAGCLSYHMGESGSSAGLSQFKGGFGADAYPYAEYWIERLPVTRAERRVRSVVKRLIGFRD